MIAKAAHTRWLSHITANISIMSAFTCLVDWLLHGDYSTTAGGRGLATIVNTFYFWRTLYYMADVLPILSTCAISLQSPSKDFTHVIRVTSQCVEMLKVYRNDITAGHFMKHFLTFFNDNYELNRPRWPHMRHAKVVRQFDDEPEDPGGSLC